MNWIFFDSLLERMAHWEQAAFLEFEDEMRDLIIGWLREFGLAEAAVAAETPRCLLALGIMAVQRRDEIRRVRAVEWFKQQTRNQVVRYWLELDELSWPPPKVTARIVRKFTLRLDGSRRAYRRAARKLDVSAGWLRRRHRRLFKWLGDRSTQGQPTSTAVAFTTE